MNEYDFKVFIDATVHYFEQVSDITAKVEAPYIRKISDTIAYQYTGIIGISGSKKGCVYFTAPSVLVKHLLMSIGETDTSKDTICDLVGEVAMAPGAAKVKQSLRAIIADSGNELTSMSREFMQALYEELVESEIRMKTLDRKIHIICKQNEACQRIIKVPGVCELTATAIVSAVPNASEFKNGRHLSAWLGLVP